MIFYNDAKNYLMVAETFYTKYLCDFLQIAYSFFKVSFKIVYEFSI